MYLSGYEYNLCGFWDIQGSIDAWSGPDIRGKLAALYPTFAGAIAAANPG